MRDGTIGPVCEMRRNEQRNRIAGPGQTRLLDLPGADTQPGADRTGVRRVLRRGRSDCYRGGLSGRRKTDEIRWLRTVERLHQQRHQDVRQAGRDDGQPQAP